MRKCMAEKHGKPFCDRDATRHLLVAGNFQSRVCDRHFTAAIAKVEVIDHHAYRSGPCDVPESEGGHWHNSTTEREGWCWIDEEGTVEDSVFELVGQETDR